jgi:hypothetical protein
MEVKGAGQQETGMMKSIGSVFENNVVADSVMGYVARLLAKSTPRRCHWFPRVVA